MGCHSETASTAPTPASERFYAAFRERFPKPEDDYVHARMQVMIEMLAAAFEKARGVEAAPVARALEGARYDGRTLGGAHQGEMRASDHQFLQPVYVSVMDRAGPGGLRHDVEGSGFGFRSVRRFSAAELAPAEGACHMQRPGAR